MPDDNIYDIIKQFNKSLDAREAEQLAAMTSRYAVLQDRLEGYIQAHAQTIADRIAKGEAVSEYAYTKLATWKDLQRQIVRQADLYERYAEGVIKAEQLAYIETGIAAAQTAITAELGAGYGFNRLNVQALENMVGITADGSPLFSVLKDRAIAPAAVEGLVNSLNEAIALGYNPRKTASMMMDGLIAGYDKALVIARTEQQRAYRTGSQMQYAESGVVMQYQRHAAPSERTCLACIALDGKIYLTDEDFASHPNCRCFATPVIAGVDNPNRSTESWLDRQSAEVQQSILGGHYELYQNGMPLQDMVRVTDDPTWGNTIKVIPLKELQNDG